MGNTNAIYVYYCHVLQVLQYFVYIPVMKREDKKLLEKYTKKADLV
jgi:hypothetical protein